MNFATLNTGAAKTTEGSMASFIDFLDSISCGKETATVNSMIEEFAVHPSGFECADVEACRVDKSDYYRPLISKEDQAYARASPPTDRCPWCSRICGHFLTCPEAMDAHEVLMPFGRHKGVLVRYLPREYLEWLASDRIEVSADVADEVCRTLDYLNQPHRNTI